MVTSNLELLLRLWEHQVLAEHISTDTLNVRLILTLALGAGKTTYVRSLVESHERPCGDPCYPVDVLANRKNIGVIRGDILVDAPAHRSWFPTICRLCGTGERDSRP